MDIYSATYDTLHYLYSKVSPGGVVLFDDWKFSYVREAIADFRRDNNVTAPVRFLPNTFDPMAFWFRCRPARLIKTTARLPETCRH